MISRSFNAAKVLAAGCLVYLAMAACTASSSDSGTGPTGSKGTTADATPGATSPVSNAMADENYVSGSRLKIQTLEGSDGSKQFFGWFDSTRQETCGFTKTSDLSYRCVPAAASVGVYFGDSSCATPLASTTKNVSKPSVALTDSGYVVLGDSWNQPVWQGALGACIGASVQTVNSNNFYSLGAAIPLSTFADATLKAAL